jgi:hypothetical protein
MPKAQTAESWLRSHVVVNGQEDCWPASGGGYNKKGWHVAFKAGGARLLAHRAMWAHVNGPVPDGQFVLHKCDNPKCCNPSHLFLGTQSDNAKDMWSKKRGNPGSTIGRKLGPAPSRKLSREQANQVVAMYKSGLTQKQIGATFSVTDVTISNVLRGLTYTELAGRNELTTLLGRGTKQKRKSK